MAKLDIENAKLLLALFADHFDGHAFKANYDASYEDMGQTHAAVIYDDSVFVVISKIDIDGNQEDPRIWVDFGKNMSPRGQVGGWDMVQPAYLECCILRNEHPCSYLQ